MEIKAYPKGKLQSFGIIGLVFVGMALFVPLQLFLDESIGAGPSLLVYYIFSMGAPLLLMHFLKQKEEGTVGYHLKPKDGVVVLLLIITTLGFQWGITGPLADMIPMPDDIKDMFADLAAKMNNGYGLITVALMAPLFEEFIFRGVMLDGLLKRKSTWTAIILSATLFGFVHLNPWQFVGATILGILIGWVYYRTRSLIYCMIIHFTNNFTASIFMYFDTDNSMMDMELVELYGGTTNMYLIISGSILAAIAGIYALDKRMKLEVEIPVFTEPIDEIEQFAE